MKKKLTIDQEIDAAFRSASKISNPELAEARSLAAERWGRSVIERLKAPHDIAAAADQHAFAKKQAESLLGGK